MVHRRRQVALLLLLLLALNGCAVQSAKAPQIAPNTATALNIGENLKQLNSDYKQFFTDLGKSKAFTPGQIASLNQIGNKFRVVLDNANRVFQTYQTTYDQSLVSQIQGYLFDAAQIYASLVTTRTQMLAAQGVGK